MTERRPGEDAATDKVDGAPTEAASPAPVVELEAELPPAPADAAAATDELVAAIKGQPPAASPSAGPSPSPSAGPSPSPDPKAADADGKPRTRAEALAARKTRKQLAPVPDPKPEARGPRPPTDSDRDSDSDDAPRPPRRWPIIVGLVAALAAGITALVLTGRANARKLAIRCGATEIVALRGRSFPPWGQERLGGAAWRPIAIPPATECQDRRTRDPIELEGWYLDALVEQAESALGPDGGDVDLAERQLQQALLLSRSADRRDQRKYIDRLLADVTYARARARVTAAIGQLREAAGHFDDAAGRQPRHAADAGAWATFVRATADRLSGGPKAELPTSLLPPFPERERPPAPPGVALPVEPVDAGVLPAPEPDAAVPGLPSGGVLM